MSYYATSARSSRYSGTPSASYSYQSGRCRQVTGGQVYRTLYDQNPRDSRTYRPQPGYGWTIPPIGMDGLTWREYLTGTSWYSDSNRDYGRARAPIVIKKDSRGFVYNMNTPRCPCQPQTFNVHFLMKTSVKMVVTTSDQLMDHHDHDRSSSRAKRPNTGYSAFAPGPAHSVPTQRSIHGGPEHRNQKPSRDIKHIFDGDKNSGFSNSSNHPVMYGANTYKTSGALFQGLRVSGGSRREAEFLSTVDPFISLERQYTPLDEGHAS
jgi:hypothetical protein